jgi:surfactin synthase thioesterase subunit
MPKLRAVIVPGNGAGNVRMSNFYGWLADELSRDPTFDEVLLRDMPDPNAARRKIWVPFMLEELKVDARTVLIGHSSGAVAALRLLQEYRVYGCVLVSSCHTDLGDEGERAAGYYPPSGGPWLWPTIRANAGGNLAVLHSDNDPFIPLHEARHVAASLGRELRIVPGASHFFGQRQPAILDAVLAVASRAPVCADSARLPNSVRHHVGTEKTADNIYTFTKASAADKAGIVLRDQKSEVDGQIVCKVRVVEVKPDGLAASSGIPIGATIISINGTAVGGSNGVTHATGLIKAAASTVEIRAETAVAQPPTPPQVPQAPADPPPPRASGESEQEQQRRASHILVGNREKALSIKREIEAGHIRFAQAATKYSGCKSAEQGGDLGTFAKGDMVREFDRYCFSTSTVPNSIGVVTSTFGTHLIKLWGPTKHVRILGFTAGLSASVFASWSFGFPIEVSNRGGKATVVPLNLGKSGATSVQEAAKGLLPQIKAELAQASAETPPGACVVFAHGLGAWVAVEALRELSTRSTRDGGVPQQLPELLVVSGIRPPHLYASSHDADRATPTIASLSSSSFWEAFKRRYGVDPDLDHADMRPMFEPALRDELRLLESYRPVAETPFRLPCDVIACAAEADPRLLPGQLCAWEAYAGEGRGFEEVVLPGAQKPPSWATPHRYLLDGSLAAQRLLAHRCACISDSEASVRRPLVLPGGAGGGTSVSVDISD